MHSHHAHVDLATPLGHIPVPWFNSIDAFVSIIAVPPLIYLWSRQEKRGREPGDIAKIGIGAAIASASAGLIALGTWLAGSGKVGALYPVLACVGKPSRKLLRILRGVEVLEVLGTTEARNVLHELARGPEERRLTAEAQAALARLAQ